MPVMRARFSTSRKMIMQAFELVPVPGSGFQVPGSGSRFKVQGSRFKVQGSRFKVPRCPLPFSSSTIRIYDDLDRALTTRSFLAPDDEVVVVDHAISRRSSIADRRAPAHASHPIAENRRIRCRREPRGPALHGAVSPADQSRRGDGGPVIRALESWLRDHPDTGVVGPRVVDWDGTRAGLGAAISWTGARRSADDRRG